jgi:outer membrane lipoprotein LolB
MWLGRAVWVLLFLVLVAGCVKKMPSIQPLQPASLEALKHLDHWQIQGALAVKSNESAVNVRFRWLQCQNRYEVRLLSPFGTSVALIRKTAAGMELFRGNEHLRASDPQELLQQVLHVPLPLDEFVFWVRGLPEPTSAVSDSTETASGRGFTQQDWQLHMDHQWQVDDAQLGSLALPRLIEFNNTALSLTGKMVINSWQTETTLACQQPQ